VTQSASGAAPLPPSQLRAPSQREHEKISIDKERQRIMGILSSPGALDQFSRFEADYASKAAELELLKKRKSKSNLEIAAPLAAISIDLTGSSFYHF
jgi:hypothetical protein